jgi:hypothetical protein
MKTNSMHAARATFLTLALLAGCGAEQNPASPGGGTPQGATPVDPPSLCDTPPEGVMSSLLPGVFGGTIVDQANGNFLLVTRDLWSSGEVDGRLFYGIDTVGPPKVAGVVLFRSGMGCSSNDKRARNGTELSSVSKWSLDYSGLYVHVSLAPAVTAVMGSIRSLDGAQSTRRLSGGPIPGSTFDASARPILEDIAGAWDLADELGAPSAITIANDGMLAGTYRQCAVAGTVEPSRDGTNLFAVRLKKDKGCVMGGLEDFVGYIVAIPLAAGGMRALFWAEVNNGVDWDFMLAVGQRQVR